SSVICRSGNARRVIRGERNTARLLAPEEEAAGPKLRLEHRSTEGNRLFPDPGQEAPAHQPGAAIDGNLKRIGRREEHLRPILDSDAEGLEQGRGQAAIVPPELHVSVPIGETEAGQEASAFDGIEPSPRQIDEYAGGPSAPVARGAGIDRLVPQHAAGDD